MASGTASGVVMATEAPRVVCIVVLVSVVLAAGFVAEGASLDLLELTWLDEEFDDEFVLGFEPSSASEFCGDTGSAPAEGRLKRGISALLSSPWAASVSLGDWLKTGAIMLVQSRADKTALRILLFRSIF